MAKAVEGIVLSERLPLTRWDPDGDTYVVFQRPLRFEAEALARMQARSELVFDTEEQGRVTQRERVPLAELRPPWCSSAWWRATCPRSPRTARKCPSSCRARPAARTSLERYELASIPLLR